MARNLATRRRPVDEPNRRERTTRKAKDDTLSGMEAYVCMAPRRYNK